MNIYEKMTIAKDKLLKANLKKSGENKFAGFKYYELADITPKIIEICNELKIHTQISFDNEYAKLIITNIENVEEQLIFTSPMKELSLKGCNDIQALGGVETYSRRYLYLTAFDIIENDMFDAKNGSDENKNKLITKTQIDRIRDLVDDIDAMLNYYKLDKIEDMTSSLASQIIERKTNDIK